MLRTPQRPTSLAVLTSGGDAAGMNAAVRAVVRAGLAPGSTSMRCSRACKVWSTGVTGSADVLE